MYNRPHDFEFPASFIHTFFITLYIHIELSLMQLQQDECIQSKVTINIPAADMNIDFLM
jgi:hypothetical protein